MRTWATALALGGLTIIGIGCAQSSASVAADAAAQVPDAGEPGNPVTICDGSDDLRLELSERGGNTTDYHAYAYPYGNGYAFVDGQCRYYVTGGSPLEGMHTGALGVEEEAALAADIGLSMLEEWERAQNGSSVGGCPGYGLQQISAPRGHVACSCQCSDTAPAGLDTALDAAKRWRRRLWEQGEPLEGPVSVTAEPISGLGGEPEWTYQAWPMSWPISEILVSPRGGGSSAARVDAGKRVDDPQEVRLLRDLRSAALAAFPFTLEILVLDDDEPYRLYIRDELPPGFSSAVEIFRAPERN